MSGGAVSRMLWKEYRMLRSFWVVLALAVGVTQWTGILLMPDARIPSDLAQVFGAGWIASALYALVCGATLFAGEHESRTYEFLRVLPCSASRLFISKLVFCVVSTLLLLITLSLCAVFLCWKEGWDPERVGPLAGSLGLLTLHCLLWGVFYSLLTVRPILAIFLGAGTALAVTGAVRANVGPAVPWGVLHEPTYLGVAGAVLLADILLAMRWFRRDLAERGGAPRAAASFRWARGLLSRRSPCSSTHDRLRWQEKRQSRTTVAALGFVAIVLTIVVAASPRSVWRDPTVVYVLMATLAGCCAFLSDQSNRQFRFFAEHGVRARDVWRNRQTFWGMVLLALLGLIAGTWKLCAGLLASVLENPLVLVMVALAFAAGQLCSMFFSSGLLVVFFGCVLSALLCGWAVLMNGINVSWSWSVAPIPAVLFSVSWLRASSWILERNDWRAWLAPCGVLGVSSVTLLTAVILARVEQIPPVDMAFSTVAARPASADAIETAALYAEAQKQVLPRSDFDLDLGIRTNSGDRLSENELAWLEANGAPLELAFGASSRDTCAFWESGGPWWTPAPMALAPLLLAAAKRAELAEDLDGAFAYFLGALRICGHLRQRGPSSGLLDLMEVRVYEELAHWGARPGQTEERLLEAQAELASFDNSLPDPERAIEVAHREAYRRLDRTSLAGNDVSRTGNIA